METPGLRIDFARSGGFAGLTFETSVDVEELLPDERVEVERLVCAVEAGSPPESTPAGIDRFQYDFTITRGDDSTPVSAGENGLTPELKALADWLLERAKSGG